MSGPENNECHVIVAPPVDAPRSLEAQQRFRAIQDRAQHDCDDLMKTIQTPEKKQERMLAKLQQLSNTPEDVAQMKSLGLRFDMNQNGNLILLPDLSRYPNGQYHETLPAPDVFVTNNTPQSIIIPSDIVRLDVGSQEALGGATVTLTHQDGHTSKWSFGPRPQLSPWK